MIPILVSQRMLHLATLGETCDALDQRWQSFLAAAGIYPLLIPNTADLSHPIIHNHGAKGILLTGGNSLSYLNGDAPQRDTLELSLLKYAIEKNLPVFGVCRGMQLIQSYFKVPLKRIDGHITPIQTIFVNGIPTQVNSYHEWGSTQSTVELRVWAIANDGVVKAIHHVIHPIVGIMWHPERNHVISQADISLFRSLFSRQVCWNGSYFS